MNTPREQISPEADYRLRLANGFLQEARQDMGLERWRSCVDNSQLAVENAAKAMLALVGPTGRTHNPAVLLREMLAEDRFAENVREQVEQVAECAELLGPDVHVQSDYGSEIGWRTPWELFQEPDGRQSLEIAERAVMIATQVFDTVRTSATTEQQDEESVSESCDEAE